MVMEFEKHNSQSNVSGLLIILKLYPVSGYKVSSKSQIKNNTCCAESGYENLLYQPLFLDCRQDAGIAGEQAKLLSGGNSGQLFIHNLV